MVNPALIEREEELKQTAETGDIGGFYEVIEREPGILKFIEEKDFAETPLHVAAKYGKAELAVEILTLKRSFGMKLNPSGYSPLDLALRGGHRDTIKQLIMFAPELIGVGSRERKNPLHYVAETNDADLVAEFLVACPTAVKELTIRGESAVHLAVQTGSMRAFEVLLGWISRTDNKKILGWKDNKGNTLLHVAAQRSQVEVTKRLIDEYVNLTEKNKENETALDVVLNRISSLESVERSENPSGNVDGAAGDLHIVGHGVPNQEDAKIKKMLKQAGAWESSKLPSLMSMADALTSSNHSRCRNVAQALVDLDKGITDDTRNAFLVVTVLILTATFQAVLSPPGGGWLKENDSNNNDVVDMKAHPTKDGLYLPFVFFNSVTFATTLALTFLLVPLRRYNSSLLPLSLIFLLLGYMICGLIMAPEDQLPYTMIGLLVGYGCFTYVIVRKIVLPKLIIRHYFRFYFPGLSRRYFPGLSMKEVSLYKMEKQVRLGKYVAK